MTTETTNREAVAAISSLIDGCCFTNDETILRLREKAEDALEHLKDVLNEQF